jgi:hypothetical protein
MIPLRLILISIWLLLTAAAGAAAADLTLTLTNLTNGTYFTPLLATAHDDAADLFEPGTAASDELVAMAEGGDIDGFIGFLGGVDADTIANPAGGLLAPGDTVTFSMTTVPERPLLSLVAMLLPTNDGFVGLDSLELPTAEGSYTYDLLAYDAGSEANDEQITGGGAPGVAGIPADPSGSGGTGGSGVTTLESNPTVHIHRGILGDGESDGGISDLDRTVHRWLNPVARLTIDLVP